LPAMFARLPRCIECERRTGGTGAYIYSCPDPPSIRTAASSGDGGIGVQDDAFGDLTGRKIPTESFWAPVDGDVTLNVVGFVGNRGLVIVGR
jgi:hypothetical protein